MPRSQLAAAWLEVEQALRPRAIHGGELSGNARSRLVKQPRTRALLGAMMTWHLPWLQQLMRTLWGHPFGWP